MKQHGAIYLTPFSHRLAEEIDEPELQRLRCRVNYHALRFKPHIMKISSEIVNRLRSQGHFMSIHLRFEMDMLAFAGYETLFWFVLFVVQVLRAVYPILFRIHYVQLGFYTDMCYLI
jgi:GDP-fucose protein O-fucosyltransferase